MDMDLTVDDEGFIKDVVDFIDAPLSPQSLNTLRQSCKARRSPQRAGHAHWVPVTGDRVEVHSLKNDSDFNGLRGQVIGASEEEGKVLIEFDCGRGQQYNVRMANVRPAGAVAELHQQQLQGQPTAEARMLQERLRLALCTVQEAKHAMRVAAELHALDPESLHNVIAEFQPTLSQANIARNWRKIVLIYQAHAERVERSLSGAVRTPRVEAAAPAAAGLAIGGEDDVAAHIEGVIDFIDKPLSPRSLSEIRSIRHSLSPRRGQSASPF